MITPKQYSTAKAFRVALEARLKQIADIEQIDPPPDNWKPVFDQIANECNVKIEIEKAFTTLEDFVESLKNKQ